MTPSLIEKPVLKAIALQFLLAHAEQPHLLQSAREPILRKWAKKKPFYEEFIQTVQQNVGYDEQKLMNSKSFIPDTDFKAILDCFKQVSGLYNPSYYTVLGRIVPSIGDAVTQLASMAAGPAGVISLSSRYNNDFNNDQEIVIEQITKQQGLVEATIQHYFLPRPSNNPAYFEKVTAALGYWEGIPSLWGYPVLGETKLNEVQIPLEQLVKQDYAYLNLLFEEKEGQIYVNQQHIGRRLNLTAELPELNTILHQEFLEHKLEKYFPIEITADFIVDNETIFPKNVRYGMPCNRYTVRIPEVSFGRKLTLILDRLWQSFFSSSQKQNRINVHRSLASTLSETMYTAQHAEEERLLAIAEAEHERANAAQSRAAAAEARLTLEQQVSGVNRDFGKVRALVHDNKNKALELISESAITLQNTLRLHPGYYAKYAYIFNPNQDIHQGVQSLLQEPSLPPVLQVVAAYFTKTSEIINEMIANDRTIMSGGIAIDIKPHSYNSLIKPVVEPIKKIYGQTKIEYQPDIDLLLNADARLLKVALTNLVSNAVEASQEGYVKINTRQRTRGGREFTFIEITQSGYLSQEHAQKLNSGIPFTTKKEGNSIGAQASYTIINDTHRGSINYTPTLLDDQNNKIEDAKIVICI